MRNKVGRPPVKAEPGGTTTLTIRLAAEMKNLLVDQSQALDLSLTDYIILLVERDVQESLHGKDSQT